MGRKPRVGLFVDGQNIGGWPFRIDLKRLIESAPAFGRGGEGTLAVAVLVIGVQPGANGKSAAIPFALAARHMGFTVFTRTASPKESTGEVKGDVDALLGFLIGQLTLRHRLDRVILVSNDSDYAPVLEQLRAQGIQTICLGPQGLMSSDLILHSDDFYYADDLKQRPAAGEGDGEGV